MNGNKPGAIFTSVFTKRLAANPRIAYYAHSKCNALVTMVIDELLVSRQALETPGVAKTLEAAAEHVGQVLPKGDDDKHNVEIFRLKEVTGKRQVPDVAYTAWQARKYLSKKLAGQVGPNHVLVPANFHTCPWGPPEEQDHWIALGEAASKVEVTVIDSGFISGGPIDPRLVSASFGSWFGLTPAGGYQWVQETESIGGADPVDQNGDCLLDALAGHANFVAGVVAQACPDARISVVSHNGSFVEPDAGDPTNTPLPTEASVARSLWETLASGSSDVINIGFAFPTLPYAPPVGVPPGGPPSWAFKVVLDEFQHPEREFFIVAPAGNQNCIVPQYPAAFWSSYDNVVGVGSVDAYAGRSAFSNHGSWVACCTEGEDVNSAFVPKWHGRTEEEEQSGPYQGTRPPKDFYGWASWTGTSFAAPKVAGALAQQKINHPGDTLRQAWADLLAAGMQAPNLQMGTLLPALPPV
jgi:subtilisin family serine protease